MRRFRNIVFIPLSNAPVPRAIDVAAGLAKENGAELTVFGVVPEHTALQHPPETHAQGREITDELLRCLSDTLRVWAEVIEPGVGSQVRTAIGRPAVEIVRAVLEHDYDLVIISTDGGDEAEATMRRVLRTCPCPVWVFRPEGGNRRVLAAVDPLDDPELNRLVLELASSQALNGQGQLRVVHAWQAHGELVMTGQVGDLLRSPRFASFAAAAEAEHRRQLDGLLADVAVEADHTVHLINASPVRAVKALIELHQIDLVVMGSIGHSTHDGSTVGDTAEQISATARCSVLMVKPNGFVSPIAQT